MFEKISHSILYWLGLMIVNFVVVLTVFKLAYTGPPSEFWNHFDNVPQMIFTGGIVLALATEVVVRSERRRRKRREEDKS